MEAGNAYQRSKQGESETAAVRARDPGGLAFRTLFIIALAVLTARVASPQIEKLRSVFETPDDLIRVVLGFALCTWCVANVFVLPRTPRPIGPGSISVLRCCLCPYYAPLSCGDLSASGPSLPLSTVWNGGGQVIRARQRRR